jgi:hypothetical protein
MQYAIPPSLRTITAIFIITLALIKGHTNVSMLSARDGRQLPNNMHDSFKKSALCMSICSEFFCLTQAMYLRVAWHDPPNHFPDILCIFKTVLCRMHHIHFEPMLTNHLLQDIMHWTTSLHFLRGLCLSWKLDQSSTKSVNTLFRLLPETCIHLLSLDIGWVVPSPALLSLPHLKTLIICFDL